MSTMVLAYEKFSFIGLALILNLNFDLLTTICLTTSQTSDTLFLTSVVMDQPHTLTYKKKNPTKTFFQLTIKKEGFDEHAVCFANKTPAQPISVQHFVLTSFTIKSHI